MGRSSASRFRLPGGRALRFAAALSAAASCHDGGGSRENAEPLRVEAAFAASSGAFPAAGVALDERIVVLCSAEIDPLTVNPDTVRIESSRPSGSSKAEGRFLVRGNRIEFVPRLPVLASLRDSGLAHGRTYRVVVPGLTEAGTIRSRTGRVPESHFAVRFETRSGPPFFAVGAAGPPRVIGAIIDLDGDGLLEGDGLAATPEPEEVFDVDRVPFSSGVRPGLASRPTAVGLLFSETLDPASILPGSAGLRLADGSVVPARVTLSQDYRAADDGRRVVLAIVPRVRLPDDSEVAAFATGIEELSAPGEVLFHAEIVFRTGAEPGAAADAIVEEFDTTEFLDRRSTARWNFDGSGKLESSPGGPGGSGADGPFRFDDLPASGRLRRVSGDRAVIETADDEGFHFTTFDLPERTELLCEGPAPVRIHVAGDARIAGEILLRGADGQTALFRGQTTAGGAAGAGGGRGGDGNPGGTERLSPRGEPGDGPPGLVTTLPCDGGEATRAGGCSGVRLSSGSGSGGGGGHRDRGGSDNVISQFSGLGGIDYGDEAITDLLGGAGGGGGGNDEDGLPFASDDPGGAGAGGGGAIAFEVGGLLEISGVVNADGGRGGNGFGQSGAGGGGAGGAIRIRAFGVAPLVAGSVTARGGVGGTLSPPGRPGGGGSAGRIRVETPSGQIDVDRRSFAFDPAPSVGTIPAFDCPFSVARSRYYATGARSPRFAFDGSDPATGALSPVSTGDLVLARPTPDESSARIVFFGAPEDPSRRYFPDESSETGPVTDVASLDGLPFVRFEIEFETSDEPFFPHRFEIERLRVRFRTE